jgi:hypothetical protein
MNVKNRQMIYGKMENLKNVISGLLLACKADSHRLTSFIFQAYILLINGMGNPSGGCRRVATYFIGVAKWEPE